MCSGSARRRSLRRTHGPTSPSLHQVQTEDLLGEHMVPTSPSLSLSVLAGF